MAVIQRTTGDYNHTNVHKNRIGRALPPRRRHRLHRESVFRVWVVKGLLLMVATWIIGIFLFCFAYFGLIRMPFGSERFLPISPHSSNNIPIQVTRRIDSTHYTGLHDDNVRNESPLLIFTCKRPHYLNKTLAYILDTIPNPCGFGCPVIVSEDGEHEAIKDVVLSYKKKFEGVGVPLIHIRHEKKTRLKGNAYEALAKHYGWALSQVFNGLAHYSPPRRVVILEEDIKVAPDFFSYMESMSSLLDNDPTLLAVSAFNDNGHLEHGDPKRVLRSDFFPGLGWMINKDLWKSELESKWPDGYWDDWIRSMEQRKGRQIIRPEVSRTYHFGTKGGASANQFGSILTRIHLNEKAIQWNMEDLSYLEHSSYESQYMKLVMDSKLVQSVEVAKHSSIDFNVRIEYEDFHAFSILAKKLGIMSDEKEMVPRTAYKGIVEVRVGSGIIFLTPKGGFHGYKTRNLVF